MPSQSIKAAGNPSIFILDKELLEISWTKEFVSIKPPKIRPNDKKTTLHPSELTKPLPDFIFIYVRIRVDRDRRSLLKESGTNIKIIRNRINKDIFIGNWSKDIDEKSVNVNFFAEL